MLSVAMCSLLLSGCASQQGTVNRFADAISVYKVEIVQGNFVSREQVQALAPGMSRTQVREILGTPLLTSLFRADRWDYVFTLKRQGVAPQARKLTVYFKGETLERFEGDEMPTESEFVTKLESGRTAGKVPVLEASEESLRKFAPEARAPAGPAAGSAAPAPALVSNYPPLEAPGR